MSRSYFDTVAQRLQKEWKSPMLGEVLLFVAALFAVHWGFHTPPSNYSLIAMAVVAGMMALRQEMKGWERSMWAVVLIVLALIEIRAINHDNAIRDAAQANALAEVTGGDSFCWIHMGWTGDKFRPAIFQRGRHNVFDVQVRISDIDKFSVVASILPLSPENQELYQTITYFPVVQAIGSSGENSFKSFREFEVPSGEVDKRYNVFVTARNGVFTELIRVHRLSPQTWAEARIMSATYPGQKPVRVMDEVDPQFPSEILDQDRDVQWFRKQPLVRIELSP